MSLKRKIAINLSLVLSLFLAMVMVVIYLSFSDFRKTEFAERFRQRLDFTINFISQSKNFEKDAPLFFIEEKDNVLLNEQILIFNQHKKLVYSTVKDSEITWDDHLLKELDTKNTIFKQNTHPEIYAALRKINDKNYYILTSAQDINGEKKLAFLRYLFISAYIISVLIIGYLSYYLLSKYLRPLEKLNQEITDITAHNLTKKVSQTNSKDEVNILAQSFNTMLTKLHEAFEAQKNFSSHAAHEIRTPITRMAFQLENLIKLSQHTDETLNILIQLKKDVYQLSDITNSLLLLAKINNKALEEIFEPIRIDEIIFESYSKINSSYPALKVDFLITQQNTVDPTLQIMGIKSLLEIVFLNLFKNTALYSASKIAKILITETPLELIVSITNDGENIPLEERSTIFQAFYRGTNAIDKVGSGLGLRIVKKIVELHQGEIIYDHNSSSENSFKITLPK